MRSRPTRNQDGATLIIVLMFISVFGLILAGLLTEAGASIKYTDTVANHGEKVYAADAGLTLGIKQLKQNNEICPTTGSSQTIQTTTVNDIPTKVECETTSGSTTGGLGYAIYTRSPASDSLQLQQGLVKEVGGPVYVTGGVDGLNKGMNVKRGNFRQLAANGCNALTDPGVKVDPGYSKLCPPTPPTVPTYAAPPVPPAAIAARTSGDGDCQILYPGTYAGAPVFDLTKTNYFATGLYYFKAPFTFEGTGASDTYYFGGARASYEEEEKFPANHPPCASDAAATSAAPPGDYTASGTGVQFIFGNGATLTVADKSRAELFERTDNGTQETSSPTVVAVPSSWATPDWIPNAVNTTVVGFTPGADKALVIHGLTYAPDHNVVFKVTNIVDAVVFGGVVAWKVEIDSSQGGGGGGLVVRAKNGNPDPRHIVVRATAPFPASASAGREVVSTTVVEITNDIPERVTIESWRTRGPIEPL